MDPRLGIVEMILWMCEPRGSHGMVEAQTFEGGAATESSMQTSETVSILRHVPRHQRSLWNEDNTTFFSFSSRFL